MDLSCASPKPCKQRKLICNRPRESNLRLLRRLYRGLAGEDWVARLRAVDIVAVPMDTLLEASNDSDQGLRLQPHRLQRMASPVRKPCSREDLISLHQHIRSQRQRPWPRWRSARRGPLRCRAPCRRSGFQVAVLLSGHLTPITRKHADRSWIGAAGRFSGYTDIVSLPSLQSSGQRAAPPGRSVPDCSQVQRRGLHAPARSNQL